MTPDGITRLNSILSQLSQNIAGDTENVRVFQGVGTPEASIAAGVGSLYMRTDGGTDTSIYRKESGSGDTGWVAVKAPATLPLSVANGGLGADNSAQVQGTILYVSATGVISFLATGTSGKFLKTQGAGANPAWSNVFSDYTAGDYYVNGNNYVNSTTSDSAVKVLEIYVARAGALRIKFYLANGTNTANGQIYRNGSAVGTLRSGSGAYSEDISGWSAGDLCQVYLYATNAGNTVYAGGLQLYTGTPQSENYLVNTTYPTSFTFTSAVAPTMTGNGSFGNVGDFWSNTSGGASTTLYVKTAAATWTPK